MSILSHSTIFETDVVEIKDIPTIREFFDIGIFNSPDYFQLQIAEKQSIGIKETRELINWLQFKPYQFDYKLACIIQAEKMTIEAQNSLLKTLEEPPASSFIVLVTSNHKRLLRTIVSRSRVIKIKPGQKAIEATENLIESNSQEDILINPANIINNSLKEQVKWIEQVAKIKNSAEKKQYVYDFLASLHENIIKNKNIKQTLEMSEKNRILHNLELIDKTHEGLRRNVNIKLLLENLLFNYSKAK